MANTYYVFSPYFIPGQKVRSDEMNTQLAAIEVAFDLMPTDNSAILRGTTYLGTDTGTANAVEIALTDPRTSYQEGDLISWSANTTNTGPATMDVDTVGAVSLVSSDGSVLGAGDITAGLYYTAVFDLANNRWQMIGASASAVAAADSRVTWASEWATQPEDTLVSVVAGGDGATDYSALHWAAKAAASASAASTSAGNASTSETNAAASEVAAAASAASTGLPTVSIADAGKHLKVNAGGTGYDAYDLFGTANVWTANQQLEDVILDVRRDTSSFDSSFLIFKETGGLSARWYFNVLSAGKELQIEDNAGARLKIANGAALLATTATQLLFNGVDVMRAATATNTGLIELATQAEVDATTDTTRAVTPKTMYDRARIKVNTEAFFGSEVDNGNSGTADTVTWFDGNKQKSTLTGNCVFTFVAPSGPTNLILRLVQDATGSRTVTWPAGVKWPAGTAPTLTTTAAAQDIMAFYFDGTYYHGSYILDSK